MCCWKFRNTNQNLYFLHYSDLIFNVTFEYLSRGVGANNPQHKLTIKQHIFKFKWKQMYSVFLKIKKKNASFTTLGMGRVEPPSIGIEDETSNESNSFEGELITIVFFVFCGTTIVFGFLVFQS